MNREDHQPVEGPVERPKRTAEQYRAECGSTVALVLAIEDGPDPLKVQFEEKNVDPVVCAPRKNEKPVARPLQRYRGRACVTYTVDAADKAGVRAIRVLSAPQLDEGVQRAVARAIAQDGSEFASSVSFDVYDKEADRAATRGAANFELYDMSYGLLRYAGDFAREQGADAVFVLASDQVRITADHLFELHEDLRRHPEAECITSWITWFARKPYLIPLSFIDSLEGSARVKPREGCSWRPLPHISVHPHVFGEELLGANRAHSPHVAAFYDQLSITARQAVAAAKLPARQRKAALADASPADCELVDAASAVLDGLKERFPRSDRAALKRADAFGWRNRRDFPLFWDRAHKGKLAYLDSAATAQRLGAALDAERDWDMHENANIYRGAYPLSMQATFTFNDARKVLEDHIGAQRRQTVYTGNTTMSANLVALNWGEWNVEEGDAIVVPTAEHHSNLLPWMMLADRKKARLVYLPLDDDGRIDQDTYAAALMDKPKLVCVAQVGNVMGMVNPIKQMAEQAHAAGARFFCDAAQSLAHMPIDVTDLGADFVAFSGHKAYGPMGIGGVWIAPEAFDEMDPVGGGGGAVSHVSRDGYYLRPKTIQYEWGTPAVSQAVGLGTAIEYLDALGMDAICQHDEALTKYLVCGLAGNPDVTVWGDHQAQDGLTGLVSFSLRGVDCSYVAEFLGKLDVAVRSGGHCALPLHASIGLPGTTRVSMGVYTVAEEIEALLAGVEACRRVLNR